MVEDTLEMLAFNLKLVGRKTRKNVLLSAGSRDRKDSLLASIRKLATLDVNLYATPGTARFLTSHGIANHELRKIADGQAPNILTYLDENRFDLVINVLTGDHDYDATSDCNLIRTLCIQNAIPLITEANLAVVAIHDLVSKAESGQYRYKLANPEEPWNLKREFYRLVGELGGFASHHAHYDKSYLISLGNLKLSQVDMQKKWDLYKYLKESYTMEDLTERISRCLDVAISQGVTHTRTFVDADETVKTLPMQAALAVREQYAGRITMEIAVQPL